MTPRVTGWQSFDRRSALTVGALATLAIAVAVASFQVWHSWGSQENARRASLKESLDYSARVLRDEMLHSATEQRMRFVAPVTAILPVDAPLLSLGRFTEHARHELQTFGLADDTLFGAFRILLNSNAHPEFTGILARDSSLRARVLKPVRAYSDGLVKENFAIVLPAVKLISLTSGDQLAVVFAHQRVQGKGVVAIYGLTHSRRKQLARNTISSLATMPILPPGIGGEDWREMSTGFAVQAFVHDSTEMRGAIQPEPFTSDKDSLDKLSEKPGSNKSKQIVFKSSTPEPEMEWLASNKILAVHIDDSFGRGFATNNLADSAWANSPWVGVFKADSSVNTNVISVVLRRDRGDAYMAAVTYESERWLLGVVVVLAIVAASAAVLQLRKQQELIRARADFVSAVSHELRTPLAQIRMFSETLLMGRAKNAEQGNRWLRIINRESERMSHLVESILLFSRSERNGTRLAREITDVSDIVREATDAFAPIASAKSVHMRSVILPHAIALVDAGAIRQVLVNLMDNAVKYGPEGQNITVQLQAAARNMLELSVTDEGNGVPRQSREQIWKPFVRLDQNDGSTGGSGLGLSVVRDLVERHGGRIMVTDNPEHHGARFIALLPRGLDGAALAEAEVKMQRQRTMAAEREAHAQPHADATTHHE